MSSRGSRAPFGGGANIFEIVELVFARAPKNLFKIFNLGKGEFKDFPNLSSFLLSRPKIQEKSHFSTFSI